MSALTISILANGALALAIVFLAARGRAKVIDEKLATYAGCISAITSGLQLESKDAEIDRIAFTLTSSGSRTDADTEHMKLLLQRASFLRLFREACLADVGEHLRLLALKTATPNGGKAEAVINYCQAPDHDDAGKVIEPRAKFGDDYIAAAQFEEEAQILNLYRERLHSLA